MLHVHAPQFDHCMEHLATARDALLRRASSGSPLSPLPLPLQLLELGLSVLGSLASPPSTGVFGTMDAAATGSKVFSALTKEGLGQATDLVHGGRGCGGDWYYGVW